MFGDRADDSELVAGHWHDTDSTEAELSLGTLHRGQQCVLKSKIQYLYTIPASNTNTKYNTIICHFHVITVVV